MTFFAFSEYSEISCLCATHHCIKILFPKKCVTNTVELDWILAQVYSKDSLICRIQKMAYAYDYGQSKEETGKNQLHS